MYSPNTERISCAGLVEKTEISQAVVAAEAARMFLLELLNLPCTFRAPGPIYLVLQFL